MHSCLSACGLLNTSLELTLFIDEGPPTQSDQVFRDCPGDADAVICGCRAAQLIYDHQAPAQMHREVSPTICSLQEYSLAVCRPALYMASSVHNLSAVSESATIQS